MKQAFLLVLSALCVAPPVSATDPFSLTNELLVVNVILQDPVTGELTEPVGGLAHDQAEGIRSFYEEQSFGQMSFMGRLDPTAPADVVDITIPGTFSTTRGTVRAAIEAHLGAPLGDWDTVMIRAHIDYGSHTGWCGGFPCWGHGSLRVSLHEVGHSAGLFHSRSYNCDYGLEGQCSSETYGDFDCVMGSGLVEHGFNAAKKYARGWLDLSSVPIVNPEAGLPETYTIGAMDQALPNFVGPRLVLCPLEGVTHYAFSFRTSSRTQQPVLDVHRVAYSPSGMGGVTTYVASLKPGQAYSDLHTTYSIGIGLDVQFCGHDGQTATLRVQPVSQGVPEFLRADTNGDLMVDVADLVVIYNYLSTGSLPPLAVIDALDVNFDGAIDIADAQGLSDYLFGWYSLCCPGVLLPGPPPAEPFYNDQGTGLEAGRLSVHLAVGGGC